MGCYIASSSATVCLSWLCVYVRVSVVCCHWRNHAAAFSVTSSKPQCWCRAIFFSSSLRSPVFKCFLIENPETEESLVQTQSLSLKPSTKASHVKAAKNLYIYLTFQFIFIGAWLMNFKLYWDICQQRNDTNRHHGGCIDLWVNLETAVHLPRFPQAQYRGENQGLESFGQWT